MNAYHLCTLLVIPMLATVTQAPVDHAASIRPVSRASTQVAPASPKIDLGKGWDTQIFTFLEDPDGYRGKASMEIESYTLATENMDKRCEQSRGYQKTRLQALREHTDYARAELVKLPTSQGEEDFTEAHAHFQRTMESLHEAFSQALNELKDGA